MLLADEEHQHERALRPAPAFLSGFNKITSNAALLGARLYFNLIQHYTQNMLRVGSHPKKLPLWNSTRMNHVWVGWPSRA
jgi:hypothetical protein